MHSGAPAWVTIYVNITPRNFSHKHVVQTRTETSYFSFFTFYFHDYPKRRITGIWRFEGNATLCLAEQDVSRLMWYKCSYCRDKTQWLSPKHFPHSFIHSFFATMCEFCNHGKMIVQETQHPRRKQLIVYILLKVMKAKQRSSIARKTGCKYEARLTSCTRHALNPLWETHKGVCRYHNL